VIVAILVIICGGSGAIVRFLVDALVQSRRGGEFPLGTLIVNLGGCLVLGLLVGLHAAHDTMLLLGTATIGSYTTFSTWMLETHRPAQDGEPGLAWRNVGISLVCGLAAAAVGRALGGLL
jgi:CrcB protein